MATTHLSADPSWASPPKRRPWLGLGLLLVSVAFTLSTLIFFGAWVAQDRIEAREDESVAAQADGEWWEDGLIAICPVH